MPRNYVQVHFQDGGKPYDYLDSTGQLGLGDLVQVEVDGEMLDVTVVGTEQPRFKGPFAEITSPPLKKGSQMTVELKDVRKVAVIGWDTELVSGDTASLQAQGEEKRTVTNDGESNLFFPLDYTGSVEITVRGSH